MIGLARMERWLTLLAEEDQVCKELLIETIAIMRRYGVNTLSAPLLGSHGGREIFEYCGSSRGNQLPP